MTDSEYNEPDLLSRVRSSDVTAFKLLFERYQPMLFRQIAGSARDADLARDIVQETFIRVWDRRSDLKPGIPFYPYIHRIAVNLIRDNARRTNVRTRFAREAEEALYPEAPHADEILTVAALEEKIRKIVEEELGERCRMIFLLSRIEGKSNTEIAAMLRLSVRTVTNQLSIALKVLRKRLGIEG